MIISHYVSVVRRTIFIWHAAEGFTVGADLPPTLAASVSPRFDCTTAPSLAMTSHFSTLIVSVQSHSFYQRQHAIPCVLHVPACVKGRL